MTKITLAAAALALAATVTPAQATRQAAQNCVVHTEAYVVAGTLASPGALARNNDGTYSGTLTVHVTKTNRAARSAKKTNQTYTLDHVKVWFSRGIARTSPAAGSRAFLLGTTTALPKSCGAFTPTVTIKRTLLVAVRPAHLAPPHPVPPPPSPGHAKH